MSYNSLVSDPSLVVMHPLQDDAASDVIVGNTASANHGVLLGGDHTAELSTTDSPAGHLPRSLYLDATTDHVQIGTTAASVPAFTIMLRVKLDSVSGLRDIAGRWSQHTGSTDNSAKRWLIRVNNGVLQFYAMKTDITSDGASSGPALAADQWHNIVAQATGTHLRVGANGTFGSSSSYSGPYLSSSPINWYISRAHSSAGPGHYADFAFFTRELSSAEQDEWWAGPEPLRTTDGAITSLTATDWSGVVSAYDSQSNGTVIVEWELRSFDDDSVFESGSTTSGGTVGGSGTYVGWYYLWCRGSNDGGYDETQDGVSEEVEVVGGEPAEGSGTTSLIVSTIGEGRTDRQGNGTATLTASSQGEGWRASSGNGQNTLSTLVVGEGYYLPSGYGESSLTVSTNGEGSSGSGGSGEVTCIVTATGEGHSNRRGNGSAPLTVNSLGIGYRQSQGSGELPAIITTIGEGYATTGSYGETLLIAASSGQGYVIRSGAGLAAMQVGTVGNGQSTEPALNGILALQTIDGLYLIGF